MPKKEDEGVSAFDALDKQIEAETEAGGDEVRLHAILTNDEVLAARAKARARLDAERRKAAMKRVEDEETERLRLEEGLTTGDAVKDELVDIVIDLAPHSDKIVINGQAYHQGFTYTVARHVADSLRETMSRGWAHQDEIDGKNKAQIFAQKRQFSIMTKGKAAQAQNTVTLSATKGIGGAVPKNLGLRPGPEAHANG